VPLPWGLVLLGFLVLYLVEDVVMCLVFQLAHVVEGTTFPTPDGSGTMQDAWDVHQLQTTA
jgi:linoleoyl-CoA desaturase